MRVLVTLRSRQVYGMIKDFWADRKIYVLRGNVLWMQQPPIIFSAQKYGGGFFNTLGRAISLMASMLLQHSTEFSSRFYCGHLLLKYLPTRQRLLHSPFVLASIVCRPTARRICALAGPVTAHSQIAIASGILNGYADAQASQKLDRPSSCSDSDPKSRPVCFYLGLTVLLQNSLLMSSLDCCRLAPRCMDRS